MSKKLELSILKLLVSLIVSVALSKNIDKGKYFITGQGLYSNSDRTINFDNDKEDVNTEELRLNSKVGRAVLENVIVGVNVSIGDATVTSKSGNLKTTREGTSFVIAPFVGYNVSLNDKFSIRPGISIGVVSLTEEFDNGVNPRITQEGFGTAFAVDLAFIHHISEQISINIDLSYESYGADIEAKMENLTNEGDTEISGLGILLGLGVYF